MNPLEQVAKKIKEADAVLIGASNGISIAEGYNIFADDARFNEAFGDFKKKYGIQSALQGAFGPFADESEMWDYFSRFAYHYAYDTESSPLMKDLYALVADKPHFVVTSNTDNHFEMAGFKPENIFEIEGNLTKMQCANRCHDTIYSNYDDVMQMLEHEERTKIPSAYLPRCPRCGGVMKPYLPDPSMNDANLNERNRAYQAFLKKYHGKKLLILELGIGKYNRLIKAPLMQLAYYEPTSDYITFNKGEVYIAPEIRDRSIGIDGDLSAILPELLEMKNENK